MVVKEYKHGAATVIVHDDCYINRSEQEIKETMENLKKICTRIAIQKAMQLNKTED